MKLSLIIIICLNAVVSQAQFGQMGATWFYDDYNAPTHQHFPRAIVSVTDTVIEGKVCHIIAGECACGNPFPNYVYETNRRVYWFNIVLNAFTLLYDFNLNQGEEWTVIAKNTVSDSLRLHVDSTGTDTINGVFCKVQYIHTVATYGLPYVFEGPMIEWIGSKFCLFPQSATCDPPSIGLRCYEDDFLGLYDTHFASSCEEIFVDSGIGVNEIKHDATLSLFPNPFHDEARLLLSNFTSDNLSMEITDAAGRIVRIRNGRADLQILKREHLEAGIYFYKIISLDGVVPGKFIII